jgi:hypothetical protein
MERKTLAIILGVVIVIMAILIYINRETFFASRTTIKYPDGCIEKYVNAKLITPKCFYTYEHINRTFPPI